MTIAFATSTFGNLDDAKLGSIFESLGMRSYANRVRAGRVRRGLVLLDALHCLVRQFSNEVRVYVGQDEVKFYSVCSDYERRGIGCLAARLAAM